MHGWFVKTHDSMRPSCTRAPNHQAHCFSATKLRSACLFPALLFFFSSSLSFFLSGPWETRSRLQLPATTLSRPTRASIDRVDTRFSRSTCLDSEDRSAIFFLPVFSPVSLPLLRLYRDLSYHHVVCVFYT